MLPGFEAASLQGQNTALPNFRLDLIPSKRMSTPAVSLSVHNALMKQTAIPETFPAALQAHSEHHLSSTNGETVSNAAESFHCAVSVLQHGQVWTATPPAAGAFGKAA